MFGKNDVYMMPLFEFLQMGGGQVFPFKPVTNTEVALGAATNKIVTKDGFRRVASNIFAIPKSRKDTVKYSVISWIVTEANLRFE